MARAVRLELDPHYNVAVVVPDFVLPTSEARRVLPTTYSREDTVFNVQRSALLIVALATGARDVFLRLSKIGCISHIDTVWCPVWEIVKLRAPGLLGCALQRSGAVDSRFP